MDGLDPIVESEYSCEEEANSSSENDHYELRECFKRNFIQKDVAVDISDNIIDNAWRNTDFHPRKARDKYIKGLSESFDRHGSWKDFVERTMVHCDKEHNLEQSPFFRDHNDATEFLDCLIGEIQDQKDDLVDGLWETCREEFYTDWTLNDEKHLKELSEKIQLPLEILTHCAQYNYDTLEKHRPIKENQSFLESYGAEITEPSEEPVND